jgi:hypothetical protein
VAKNRSRATEAIGIAKERGFKVLANLSRFPDKSLLLRTLLTTFTPD